MNVIHHVTQPQENVAICIASNAIPSIRESRSARLIVFDGARMLISVHFDHQSRLRTQEIDDVSRQRHLTPEAESLDPTLTERLP